MHGQSKVKKTKKQTMLAFLQSMSEKTTLSKIKNEVMPKKAGGNRQDSDIVWDGLEFYFKDLKGEGTVRELSAKQGCGTDLQCLRMKVIENLNVFDEEMLKQLQVLAAAMHNPPFNSLKDWFTPITSMVRLIALKLTVSKLGLFKKYL